MKKLLLLFLIGTTCTINAQKLNKSSSKDDLTEKEMMLGDAKVFSKHHLNEEIFTIPDKKKVFRFDSHSSEASKVAGWINISEEQLKAGSGSTDLYAFAMYPDTTVKQLFSSGSLNNVTLSGYGQTINFNNEALAAATDFQFITSRDTVNVDTMRLSHVYVRSKTMVATKSDSILVSFGVVPRDPKADWVGFVSPVDATAINPKATSYIFPKATGGSATQGFQKVFTGTGVFGLETVSVPLISGAVGTAIDINKKLINDSLFFYYVTYKPAELAPVNNVIFDWGNPELAKYSSFRFLFFSDNALPESKRYFDDQELTTVSGFANPFSYTTNFVQTKNTRYGLTDSLLVFNILGANTDFYVSGNSTLSTNEKLAPKFAMAPNPANNTLSINFKEVGQKSIEIVDVIGRVISQYTANNTNKFNTNDISNLPNGLYFVKITNDLGISATKRLIVSH